MYSTRFDVLLWLEELRSEREVRQYDMSSVSAGLNRWMHTLTGMCHARSVCSCMYCFYALMCVHLYMYTGCSQVKNKSIDFRIINLNEFIIIAILLRIKSLFIKYTKVQPECGHKNENHSPNPGKDCLGILLH